MIDVLALEKRFGALRVLDGLDLRLRPGRITAIIGPNGSGKTTLIKSILGLVRPDAGELRLRGLRVEEDDCGYRADIGYMPQIARFPENLSAREVLWLLRDLRGIDSAALDTVLMEQFAIEPHLDKPLRTLSGGTRQKVNAIIAFLFRPSLLILDEPTAGLDPVASGILKDRIQHVRSEGRTILVTSHIISELEELAQDVAFLLDGRVCFSGSVAELRGRTGESRLERAIARVMVHGVAPEVAA